MKRKRKSQADMILDYLKEKGRISRFPARRLFRCERLAARICDLRGRGYAIRTVMQYEIDEGGNVIKYAVYYYEGAKE